MSSILRDHARTVTNHNPHSKSFNLNNCDKMPLCYADASIDPFTLLRVPDRFIIFYCSLDHDGELWCPVSPSLLIILQKTTEFSSILDIGM